MNGKHQTGRRRILLLAEGDAETRDSWSGSSHSVLMELRRRAHLVTVGDVELRGLDRWTAAALTVCAKRARWRTRYRLAGPGFELRSRRAARCIAMCEAGIDLILQVGATFEPRGRSAVPYVLFCDSNIHLTRAAAASGFGDAPAMSNEELRAVEMREARVYEGAAAIFTLSEHTRQSFIRDFGLPEDRVVTVYAGPNFDLDAVPVEVSADLARPPTILFVGRQFARKGGDILMEAFRRVRRTIPNAELVVVGPQCLSDATDGVKCLGFVDKDTPAGWTVLAEAYRNADVFCLPTRFEAFGIVYIEAMHFGLPCVGTDVWAVPEIIVDGETGFLIPADDVELLANRLIRLLEDRDLARRMGAAGLARARTQFTWSAVVDRMLEALVGVP